MEQYSVYNLQNKLMLKLNYFYTESDSFSYKAKSNKIKATKRNIAILIEYINIINKFASLSNYNCNGSRFTSLTLKVKNGKCWLKEYTYYNH